MVASLAGWRFAYPAYKTVGPVSASATGLFSLLLLRRLDRGQRDGVDDIVNQRTT